MRTEDELITLKKEACRPVCRRRQSVTTERGNQLFAVTQVTRKLTKIRGKTLKANRFGLSWTDKGSKSSLTVKRKFENTNSKLVMTQKLNETIESQQEEHRAQADERRRKDHQLLHEQLLKQNWDLREAHEKSLNEMEKLKRFQSSTFDTIARRRSDTILELTGKIHELQNEIECKNDSKDFQGKPFSGNAEPAR